MAGLCNRGLMYCSQNLGAGAGMNLDHFDDIMQLLFQLRPATLFQNFCHLLRLLLGKCGSYSPKRRQASSPKLDACLSIPTSGAIKQILVADRQIPRAQSPGIFQLHSFRTTESPESCPASAISLDWKFHDEHSTSWVQGYITPGVIPWPAPNGPKRCPMVTSSHWNARPNVFHR